MSHIRNTPPLVVFLLLGLGVFALDRWADGGTAERRVIEVTDEQVAGIRERWAVEWGRPPTDQELRGLLDHAVREEILYREALRLGLERDDTIVRRRLAQKMTFMLEDGTAVPAPADAEVEAYHATHVEQYREPGRTTFAHVFLSDDRRADPLGDARALLQDVRAREDETWRQLGDAFMLLREYADRTDQELAELFGGDFASAVTQLAVGDWHGPIRSAYGTHLVRVMSRTEPRAPAFVEVRDRVVEDLIADRRREQDQAALQTVVEGYEVLMPPSSVAPQP